MYVRGYLQGSENSRVVTIEIDMLLHSEILYRLLVFSSYFQMLWA